jgi:CDP-diacylglycerol---glycerol-3-phosphate 3-phosphatidyltransferase
MIEFLKPFYTGLLGPFARAAAALHLHPNAITALGVVFSGVAAWFIAQHQWFLAAVFIGLCACMDGLDGLIATLTGKKTRFGAIFDSSSDRITEILWFLGLMFFYCDGRSINRMGIFVTFIALSGSMMVSYVRARCEGVGVPCSEGLIQRPERIIVLIVCLLTGPRVMAWGLAALSCAAYATVLQRLTIAYTTCLRNGNEVHHGGQIGASKKNRTDHQSADPA